jgi:xylem cysteine proteinase
MKAALAKGAVALGIKADAKVFRFHDGASVITSRDCGQQPNHQVLGVGYGTHNGNEYILIRNSHSVQWGAKGYGRIGMTKSAG